MPIHSQLPGSPASVDRQPRSPVIWDAASEQRNTTSADLLRRSRTAATAASRRGCPALALVLADAELAGAGVDLPLDQFGGGVKPGQIALHVTPDPAVSSRHLGEPDEPVLGGDVPPC